MGSSSQSPIRFYYDFISHNAFVAWHALADLAQRHDRAVEPVAVLFAGLLNAQGTVGPAETPDKRDWMLRDVLRKAHRLGLHLQPPASHPFNPLLALRVASLPLAPAARRRLVDGLFRACWCRSLPIDEEEVVRGVADEAGLDGAELVAAAAEPDAKQRLRRQTDDALALRVFGVPTMIVDGELFWGFDDLGHLEGFLAGEDPLADADLEPWKGVRPTAHRRRPRD